MPPPGRTLLIELPPRLVDDRILGARIEQGLGVVIEGRQDRRDAARAGAGLEQRRTQLALALEQQVATLPQARMIQPEHRLEIVPAQAAGKGQLMPRPCLLHRGPDGRCAGSNRDSGGLVPCAVPALWVIVGVDEHARDAKILRAGGGNRPGLRSGMPKRKSIIARRADDLPASFGP